MNAITSKTAPKPWLLGFRSSEKFILSVISVAMLTDIFIYSTIVPILPEALIVRAGIPEQDTQRWVSVLLAAYGGALLLGSPIFGYLADQYQSRKIPFVLGLAALGISTVFFMISVSPWMLLVARSLQGISAAAVFVVGLAMVPENVEKDRIAEAMGYTTIAMTLGSLLGPMIGGFTYEKLGYYGVFVLPIVLIVLDIILRFTMIEKSVAQRWQQASSHPELASEESPLLPSELRSTSKNNDSGNFGVFFLLRHTRLPLTLIAMIVISLLIPAFESTLPLFVMETFHWSPSGAGLIFLALSIPCFSGAMMGKIVDRFGTRYPSSIGFAAAAIALSCLGFVENNTMPHEVLLVGLLSVISICVIIVQVGAMAEVFFIIEETGKHHPGVFGDKSPVAQVYALLSVATASSHLCGPLLAGFVRENAGWKIMTLVLGLLCGLMAIIVGLFGGDLSPYDQQTDEQEV